MWFVHTSVIFIVCIIQTQTHTGTRKSLTSNLIVHDLRTRSSSLACPKLTRSDWWYWWSCRYNAYTEEMKTAKSVDTDISYNSADSVSDCLLSNCLCVLKLPELTSREPVMVYRFKRQNKTNIAILASRQT